MRHNQYGINFQFMKEPEEFDKYTDKEFLSYCLGATLYMPALRDFSQIVLDGNPHNLTSMVVCFEDAIDAADLEAAERIALHNIKRLEIAIEEKMLDKKDLPLIFFRVRDAAQFEKLIEVLEPKQYEILAGFVFPKFSSRNGEVYFRILEKLCDEIDEPLYGMPILESEEIAFNETRRAELNTIYSILNDHKDKVLNVRIGGTDFSSCFGVRRGIDYSIYDILTVRECLTDILNTFGRNGEYVISGPVWEYFLANKSMVFDENLKFSLQSSILKRKKLINEAIDGLIREVVLDKANGIVGKTVIHPTHIKFVNAMQAVTEEEYEDAMQILKTSGGVIKSPKANKMNEISPHMSWAKKIEYKARAYGVIKDETSYIKLISAGDYSEQKTW